MKINFIALLFCVVLFGACKTTQTNAPKPDTGKNKQIPVYYSTINLPVRVSLTEIEKKINQQFTGVLYDDPSYENNNNDNLIVKITKLDHFSITGMNEYFMINAPLDIYVKGRVKKDLFSFFNQDIGIDQAKDARFRINIKVKSKIGIRPDWEVHTISEVGFEWRERPYLEIGPVKFPIGTIIEKIVNNQMVEINKRIDAEINKNIKIKPLIENYWASLQMPVQVSETYKSYLQIIPESIALAPIQSDQNHLTINLSLKSQLNLISGGRPVVTKTVPLPKLSSLTKTDSSFNLCFVAEIPYAYATELAKQAFLNKTFSFEEGKQIVTVKDIEIYGNGDRLGMRLSLDALAKKGIFKKKFKGDVYALGVPVYDANTQIVSISGFDFDVKSKDVLVGTAEWLFKGNFRKQIENQLRYSLKEDIQRSTRVANDALNNTPIDNMYLQGDVKKIEPVGVFVDAQSLKVMLRTIGDLKVQIRGF